MLYTMENPTYYETIVKSKQWQDWIKHQEKVMEFDVHESIECGWLSEKHGQAFIEWLLKEQKKNFSQSLVDAFTQGYTKRIEDEKGLTTNRDIR